MKNAMSPIALTLRVEVPLLVFYHIKVGWLRLRYKNSSWNPSGLHKKKCLLSITCPTQVYRELCSTWPLRDSRCQTFLLLETALSGTYDFLAYCSKRRERMWCFMPVINASVQKWHTAFLFIAHCLLLRTNHRTQPKSKGVKMCRLLWA